MGRRLGAPQRQTQDGPARNYPQGNVAARSPPPSWGVRFADRAGECPPRRGISCHVLPSQQPGRQPARTGHIIPRANPAPSATRRLDTLNQTGVHPFRGSTGVITNSNRIAPPSRITLTITVLWTAPARSTPLKRRGRPGERSVVTFSRNLRSTQRIEILKTVHCQVCQQSCL